ncbi:MAG: ATP synthase A1 subunit C [Methanobacteriota archaeon]
MPRLLPPSGNYAYVNARVKARRRNLLTGDAYPKLMKMGPGQIARLLGETAYREEMLRLASSYEGDELLEMALNANLSRTYRDVLGFCKGELHGLVKAYLDRWNVWNLKTVIRGVHHGIPADEVLEGVIAGGSLSRDDFATLLKMESALDIIEHVRQWGLDSPPAATLEQFAKDGNLGPVEDFYDTKYYARLLESIQGNSKPIKIYRWFVRTEIGITNSKNLMKLKLEGVAPARITASMIPGGRAVHTEKLETLATGTAEEALEEIKKALDDDLGGVKATDRASAIALELDRYLLRIAEHQSHIYPLSILPVLNFIIQKKDEVDFVRLIVRGKSGGIPDEKIQEMILT